MELLLVGMVFFALAGAGILILRIGIRNGKDSRPTPKT